MKAIIVVLVFLLAGCGSATTPTVHYSPPPKVCPAGQHHAFDNAAMGCVANP